MSRQVGGNVKLMENRIGSMCSTYYYAFSEFANVKSVWRSSKFVG
jgi:hypothetical protein